MIINAIKFRTPEDSAPKVWRFGQSSKEHQNFQCFYARPQDLKNFRLAVLYALTGEPQIGISEATIQMTRSELGDTWIVERTKQNVRMIKNGVLLDEIAVSETLLGAFLDLDEGVSPQAFDFFILKYENQIIKAIPLKEDHPGPRRIAEIVESNRSDIRERIAVLFQQPLFNDDRVIHTIMKTARPLWETYREQLRQQRTLLAKTGEAPILEQADLDRIEREVEVMHRINGILQPLVDPAQTPKVLKEKLNKIESDLNELMRDCQLREAPAGVQANIPWEKLLNTLTRLVTYQSLVEASDKLLEVVETQCRKISTQYIETLGSLICSDNQIIAELESCLATLSLQFEDITEPKKNNVSELISKFIKPTHSQGEASKRDRLDNARMAVDYVLARLGELHGNIQTAREEEETAIERMRDRHEAFVKEHGKLSKLWQHHVQEFNLPNEMTIKQLLKLITHHGRLAALKEERSRLRQVLQNRRTSLQALEDAVIEWRHIAQSQKDSPLNNPSLLIAEAQGIVRYLPKKEDTLQKCRHQIEQQRSLLAIKQNIVVRKEEVEQNWIKLFNELHIPVVGIARVEWADVFQLGNQYLAWEMIRNQSRKPASGHDIFSDRHADAPISFYSCLSIETTNAQRLALLQSIENNSSTNLQVLLISDPNLRDMLAKLGVGICREVVPEELRPKAPKQQPTRAQQILELLNQKQS